MSDIIVNKVIKGDETYLDLTNDTVSEGTLLKNRTAHNSEGIQIQGVMEEGGGSVTGVKGDAESVYRDGNVNITAANIGTYTASQIDALLNNKVDVHGTDSLMTNAEHVKLAGIEAGAEENVIESISLNGEEITPVNKAVALSVIDKDVDDLTNYYKKSEIDTSLGAKQNIILSSTLSIGGQTVTEVEEALGSLAGISKPMTGATSSAAGEGGFVPSPSAGDENKALFGDGTWKPVSGGGGGGHTILDEDGITYPQRSKLQFEGCEITDDAVNGITVVKCEGGGGSKISISTNETSLYGKTVTITGTSETKTATIGNDGKAVIDGFIDTGSVTISASDGTETASVTISIPYFGNYTVSLSFWAATLSISTDSPDLYGQTITVKDSNNQTVATSVFSGQGTATATVNAADTYTVSCVGDGVTVSESVTVSAETTYSVSLHLWTATVSISTSSSELYSATITVKKSGSTVGTTSFSAQGTATYNAHETGTYTFECVYSGQTYSDSVTVSAETSYSVMINTVPDGSTVTPTDDIQIWLSCAGITDKSYTTLAEVLADSTTLAALMLNHNAVDYLVRSKSWTTANGLVPVMTSDTTPSGEAICNTYYTNCNPYKAFNKVTTDDLYTSQSHFTGYVTETEWCGYHFPYPVTVTKLTYKNSTYAANIVFKVQGSNDGTNWITLGDTYSAPLATTEYEYDIPNTTPYSYYRCLYVSGTGVSGGSNIPNVTEIQFYATSEAQGICDNATAMTDIGADDYCADTLSSDATWANAIANSQYMESVWDVKVPTMTSNNTPSGETNYYKVFDGATYLNTGVTEVQIGSNDDGGYVYYLFANNIKITPYQFKFASAGFTGATDWLGAFSGSIDVSDDGTNWTTVDSHTWTQAEHVATYHNPQSYHISNPNHLKGRYIRLNIPMGNYIYDRQTFVGLLNFYGRATS